MDINKENIEALIGTTEGFSAEAVREQLEVRRVNVEKMLIKFRRFYNIKEGVKK